VHHSKKELRQLAKERLAQISDIDHREKSKDLSQNLNNLLIQQNTIQEKLVLGGFAPLGDEADWYSGLDKTEIVFAFPGIDENGEMAFFKSQLDQLIETEEFGVKLKTPKDKHSKLTPSIILIPGLAFSPDGDRLGRGKGFFDKYLQQYNGLKIGICFKEQIFESIPTEKHDQFVDYVVTDGKIYRR